jgi:hypothetical protein
MAKSQKKKAIRLEQKPEMEKLSARMHCSLKGQKRSLHATPNKESDLFKERLHHVLEELLYVHENIYTRLARAAAATLHTPDQTSQVGRASALPSNTVPSKKLKRSLNASSSLALAEVGDLLGKLLDKLHDVASCSLSAQLILHKEKLMVKEKQGYQSRDKEVFDADKRTVIYPDVSNIYPDQVTRLYL